MNTFLTSRNAYDEQITAQQVSSGSCEGLIEAATRRMIKVDGAMATAVRIQRVADIVAAIDVKPIEHWRAASEQEDACLEPDADEAPPSRSQRIKSVLARPFASPIFMFWAGYVLHAVLAA